MTAAHPELTPRTFNLKRDGTLIADLVQIAGEHGFEIQSCAEEIDLCPWGVEPGKCIDDGLIRRLLGRPVSARKDQSQRAACGCIESRDIGMYDSCLFGCVYCYATRSFDAARRHHAAHNPLAESLLGGLSGACGGWSGAGGGVGAG